MKYNCCLLDRLYIYSTKCKYMQIHFFRDFLRITCTEKARRQNIKKKKKDAAFRKKPVHTSV